MSDEFQLNAELRNVRGKGFARRLRREEDKIPAVIYGAKKDTQSISLRHNEVIKALENEAFYSHILTIKLPGKEEQVVIKDILRHPYKPKVMHMDFLRIKAKEKLTMQVPIHFIGEEDAPGLKEGGVVSKSMTEVEVTCLPADLPQFIELNISELALEQTLHLSDIKLPSGVELTIAELDEEHDLPVIGIHVPRVAKADLEAEAAEAAEAEAEGEAKPEAEEKEEGESSTSK